MRLNYKQQVKALKIACFIILVLQMYLTVPAKIVAWFIMTLYDIREVISDLMRQLLT